MGVALVCLESPDLAAAVREALAEEASRGERTIPGDGLVVDVRRSVALWRGAEYAMGPLGPAAQELVLAGGLEALTRRRLGLA